jgi:hypothetical protein
MKKYILASAVGVSLLAASVNAQTVWSEDFTGFAAPADYIQGVANYTFGFDGDTNAAFDTNVGGGDNVKKLSSELWAKSGGAATAFGFNDVGGGNIALQTNNNGSGTMKGAGVFLASSIFTAGTGTYKLTYDLLADGESNNVNTRIWIGTSSTHDQTATNGWGIDLSDVNLGTPASPFLTSGTTIVGATASANLNTSANIIGGELVFSYTAGEDVSLVFGSGGTNAAFDNLSISYIVGDGGAITQEAYDAALAEKATAEAAQATAEAAQATAEAAQATAESSLANAREARAGSTVIDVANDVATITLTVEQTSDLNDWSSGSSSDHDIELSAPAGASFYRFTIPE